MPSCRKSLWSHSMPGTRARQRSGAEQLKGHDSMALERCDLEVRHMVIFDVFSGIHLRMTKETRCGCSLRMPGMGNLRTGRKKGRLRYNNRKAGYSKKFRAEHEADILIHQAAKKYFDGMGITKLPSVKALREEQKALLASSCKKVFENKFMFIYQYIIACIHAANIRFFHENISQND